MCRKDVARLLRHAGITVMDQYVIAVDGPSGVGKTTVSRGVAEQLGCAHLDTGAFYRAATVIAIMRGAHLDIEADVLGAVSAVTLDYLNGEMVIEGIPVNDAIRSERITSAVSQVAAYPSVRAALVSRQRDWVGEHDHRAAVEGRDIGTVVFPGALTKIYLTAREDVRAARRAGETIGADLSKVQDDLKRRDSIDSTRTASPLAAAPDAVVIDTSDISQADVIEAVMLVIDGGR